jgi:hypothetical protein
VVAASTAAAVAWEAEATEMGVKVAMAAMAVAAWAEAPAVERREGRRTSH